jgi:hypothetical protein
MTKTLKQIAEQLRNAEHKTHEKPEKSFDIKVQLIYAFNGIGKTRLSREFKKLISPKNDNEETALTRDKILYYNAFTEDLFYWDNDLKNDDEIKLKIHPNSFTNWILKDQGQDQNIITNFQRYTDEKLMPSFNEEYFKYEYGQKSKVEANTEVTFSFMRGDNESSENIKISKGEESNFIWSIFYTLIQEVVSVLNISESSDRSTNQFDNLEYIFVDDPVSSLDENHLIELAVDLAQLIKSCKSPDVKFIITTHSPLFYNVLHNELNKNIYKKYILRKNESGQYELKTQSSDSPFSYHLYLKAELEKAISEGQVSKFHFNFLRNILEKTSTFLGYENWGELLSLIDGDSNAYKKRIINISSHSKHTAEEVVDFTENDKRTLIFLVNEINKVYHFKKVIIKRHIK